MSNLTVLSDVELDAVSGGSVTISGGAGGNGGAATNGAYVSVSDGGFGRSNFSVNDSVAVSRGGNGGAGVIVVVRGGR